MTMFPRATEAPMAVYRRYLAQGKLAYQYSPNAKAAVFFPRIVCPLTGSTELEWRVSEGSGTVYSVTVVRERGVASHNVVLVDLDEGFRILSTVEGVDPTAVRIGMRVVVKIKQPDDKDGDPYPVFTVMDAS
jgi:uncharacterized OB-fold protein